MINKTENTELEQNKSGGHENFNQVCYFLIGFFN